MALRFQKNTKKLKKVSKKVLTKGIGSDIILRLSRRSDSEKLLEN